MIALTKGKNKSCKTRIGGVSYFYLFPFIKYSRSQIVRSGLTLTSFPTTPVLKYYGVNLSFTDSQSTEDGGKFFNESFSADLIGLETNSELPKIIKGDYRLIVKDNNGRFRLLGAYNGLSSELNATTGGGQAEFSGYSMTFEGIEREQALYIDNLNDAGFSTETDNYIFQDGNNYILQENNNFIFN